MSGNADLALVRRVYTLFAEGDLDELHELLHPDVEQYVPGTHPWSGVFHGAAAVLANLRATVEATDGTLTVELQEVFSDLHGRVIAVDRSKGHRHGHDIDTRVAILFTVADGQIVRFAEFYSDPADVEGFWS
ncbi:nuclear transport factor 2 family protein [Streptomyces sp. NPDC098789]|uniref:nuclear transport factor 2 family protein n=1 Tax=Streptomyces sp. NPDC098789 TaxID=3366098 RepID=UPI00380FB9A1